jgi:hypothetical protein
VIVRRGDGLGLEISAEIVRGVRLSADEAGGVAAVSEVVIGRSEDDTMIVDALVRTRGQLGESGVPTRVAWFPPGATLQRQDATGRGGTELNEMRHDLARRFDIGSTMLVDAEARRWMLALRWDHARAWRLQELVERAGFAEVELEPAPVAIHRVLERDIEVVRRDVGPGHAWSAVLDAAGPMAAATVSLASREYPGLACAPTSVGLYQLQEVLPDADLDDELGRIVGGTLGNRSGVAELDVPLRVVGTRYPPYPAHDLRAPQRVVVALGAAVGAAGLAGRLRPVDVLAPTNQVPDVLPRPWAIERVVDEPTMAERSMPSGAQRLRARIGSFLRR